MQKIKDKNISIKILKTQRIYIKNIEKIKK